jgi:Sulfotransferase family
MPASKTTLDFIVIGAQKAGTTSLFRYLREHPEISLPDGKEWPYFSHDRVYERGWEAYIANLSRNGYHGGADPLQKWGTVTPQYMVGGVYQRDADRAGDGLYDEHTVPTRVRECLPEVRLVAILRDPVERAISHHRMAVMRGQERRSFDAAITALLDAGALAGARRFPEETNGYVTWGEYGRILAGYLDVFPREQLLVTFTSELHSVPVRVLSSVHSFLGVSADFQPRNLGERYREGATVRMFSWRSPSSWMSPSSPLSPQGVGRALRRSPVARTAWHALPPAKQARLRRPYQAIASGLARQNRRRAPNRVSAHADPTPAVLARLREHYEHDRQALVGLGITPPWPEV